MPEARDKATAPDFADALAEGFDAAGCTPSDAARELGRSTEAFRQMLTAGGLPSPELLAGIMGLLSDRGVEPDTLKDSWLTAKIQKPYYTEFWQAAAERPKRALTILRDLQLSEPSTQRKAALAEAIQELLIFEQE